jgi:hypothetical protein
MTGQELYNTYKDILTGLNTESDPWEDLDETDRTAWTLLAAELEAAE